MSPDKFKREKKSILRRKTGLFNHKNSENKESNIEYFETISAVKKKNQKEKGKQSGIQSKKVAADSTNYEEYGMITYYGNAYKKRGNKNKFHNRWMVLRGIRLFWYRKPLD